MFANTTLMLEEAYIRDITTIRGAISRFTQMAQDMLGEEEAEDPLDGLHGELGEIAGIEDIPWQAFVDMTPTQLANIIGIEASHFHKVWADYNQIK